MFGMSRNPLSPCLLFALLFDPLCFLEENGPRGNADFGRNGSEKIPNVPQDAGGARRGVHALQEVQNSQNVALQEKTHRRILKSARNIPDTLQNNGTTFIL
jgi:hypothetical protein